MKLLLSLALLAGFQTHALDVSKCPAQLDIQLSNFSLASPEKVGQSLDYIQNYEELQNMYFGLRGLGTVARIVKLYDTSHGLCGYRNDQGDRASVYDYVTASGLEPRLLFTWKSIDPRTEEARYYDASIHLAAVAETGLVLLYPDGYATVGGTGIYREHGESAAAFIELGRSGKVQVHRPRAE